MAKLTDVSTAAQTQVVVYDSPRLHEVNTKDESGRIVKYTLRPGVNEVPAEDWKILTRYAGTEVDCSGLLEEIERGTVIEVNTGGRPMSPEVLGKVPQKTARLIVENTFDVEPLQRYFDWCGGNKAHRVILEAVTTQLDTVRKSLAA